MMQVLFGAESMYRWYHPHMVRVRMTDRIPKVSPVDLLHARNDDTCVFSQRRLPEIFGPCTMTHRCSQHMATRHSLM